MQGNFIYILAFSQKQLQLNNNLQDKTRQNKFRLKDLDLKALKLNKVLKNTVGRSFGFVLQQQRCLVFYTLGSLCSN